MTQSSADPCFLWDHFQKHPNRWWVHSLPILKLHLKLQGLGDEGVWPLTKLLASQPFPLRELHLSHAGTGDVAMSPTSMWSETNPQDDGGGSGLPGFVGVLQRQVPLSNERRDVDAWAAVRGREVAQGTRHMPGFRYFKLSGARKKIHLE